MRLIKIVVGPLESLNHPSLRSETTMPGAVTFINHKRDS